MNAEAEKTSAQETMYECWTSFGNIGNGLLLVFLGNP